MTDHNGGLKLAIVLWSGVVGGAEVYSVALAKQMRQMGAEVTIVFIESPQPLASRFPDSDVSYRTVGLHRGREILRHPRRYAAEVRRAGPDGALLTTCGYMGAALRAGGYSGSIVAAEHGDVIPAQFYSRTRRAIWRVARASGAWADDLEVAVSDYILELMRRSPHAGAGHRIYNGIDPTQYALETLSVDRASDDCVIGFASRLVHGKGADHLIRATAGIHSSRPVRLLIAGDGPERPRLEALARTLGIEDAVQFLGLNHDMPSFWHSCDIAAVPSAEFIESCPMTPLEAMACGKPLVATHNGGLPELVVDGVTGLLVAPGDAPALSDALSRYASSKELRISHGAAGQAHVENHFHINRSAQAYLDLFEQLAADRHAKP